MHPIHQLFNAEEAFVRVGQTGQSGCLVIISPEGTVRLFVENGVVINAFSENTEGEKALERALNFPDASHVWIPDAKSPKKAMTINIAAYVLKNSIARDIHIAKTGKLHASTGKSQISTGKVHASAERSSQKIEKKKAMKHYYLIAEDQPGKKLIIEKGTVIVGRDESCDIVLNNTEVSRRHCLMQIITRGLSFRDLDSTNGILVNGFPAQEGLLNPHDKLQFGSYTLEVRRDS